MLLQYADGEAFATGALQYEYRPATERETAPRITIQVQVGDLQLTAFVDTGGIYLICPSNVAFLLGLQPDESVGQERLLLRGRLVNGALHRMPLTFLAAEGEDVTINTTAFVVRDEHLDWGNFPCVLGMQGCLERIRFAVDPANDIFYFGELS